MTRPAFAAQIATTYPMHDSFEAWRLRDGPHSVRIEIDATSLADALTQAQSSCGHHDTLFIVQTGARSERRVLHAWRIRQGKRVYRGVIEGYVTPLKLDALFSMEISAFLPVEPWVWTPGCDVVGVDRREVPA